MQTMKCDKDTILDCSRKDDITEIKADMKSALRRLTVLETINSMEGKRSGMIYGGLVSVIVFLVGNLILYKIKALP
jgi:hypothetical protein